MSHDIEANFTEEYDNEEKHCCFCDSFVDQDGQKVCKELEIAVPAIGHCDFFRARD